MAYQFEDLGDERFQQLCQSILTRVFPDIQCLPVGQPDGGRDAFARHIGKHRAAEFVIYQVKYVREPASRKARDLLAQVINSERKKVERLIKRGASKYYLLTNVRGTSHLDVGSIDKINETLSSHFSIPCYCWWRDDLERRIDTFSDIKWSFPDILRATDVMQMLLENENDSGAARRIDVLKAYVAFQYNADAKLKFKQIDLQLDILDMFVDVPAEIVIPSGEEARARWKQDLNPRLISLLANRSTAYLDGDDIQMPGAARLLADADIALAFPKIVIEGAPGQGKSTVTQYLCQIHRLLLLPERADRSRIEKDRLPAEARIPFRVDLRDYASWLSGRDPFSNDMSARIPSDATPLLESFLAAQVHRFTGRKFSVDDLAAVTRSSQLLIMLDGFDEVADIPTRNRLVNEISDAATRLQVCAKSLQIVVTSRPAAFANSPGFSREEWQHIQILSLSRAAIDSYTKKWLDVRGVDAREKREITGVLREKLDQPHVRDLARNPMQLAILLALISVQGASLPDKRTSLYDRYIDIYFDRESDKSKLVRDHRDLLIQIHRYLAWVLQAEAEENAGKGNISEERLCELLRSYLDHEGHETGLVDDLFTGLRERVGALVSRVQGTYEFEVQPLREYFAARYLYDTAPYSPAGSPRFGTLPHRFEAIARNFYWLNVTRFYAGCYNSGELASLLDGLEELESTDQFRYIGHIRRLYATLLSDYVFSQMPRLVTRVVERLTQEHGFRILLANSSRDHSITAVQLPAKCGGPRLVEIVKKLLTGENRIDAVVSLARVLASNSDGEELADYWRKLRLTRTRDEWILLGVALRVFETLPVGECLLLADELDEGFLLTLFSIGRDDVFEASPSAGRRLLLRLFDSSQYRYFGGIFGRSPTEHGIVVSVISRVYSLFCYLTLHLGDLKEGALRDASRRFDFRWEGGRSVAKRIKEADLPVPRHLLSVVDELLIVEGRSWRTEIGPWSQLIEAFRDNLGERLLFSKPQSLLPVL